MHTIAVAVGATLRHADVAVCVPAVDVLQAGSPMIILAGRRQHDGLPGDGQKGRSRSWMGLHGTKDCMKKVSSAAYRLAEAVTIQDTLEHKRKGLGCRELFGVWVAFCAPGKWRLLAAPTTTAHHFNHDFITRVDNSSWHQPSLQHSHNRCWQRLQATPVTNLHLLFFATGLQAAVRACQVSHHDT